MVNPSKAGALLIVAAIGVIGSSGAAETQLVPPRLGERIIDPPIANEYEAAAAYLFGMTLSPPAMVKACAHLYPEFNKENSAALEAWERRHADARTLIHRAAREMLLKHSAGNASWVESTLQKHAMDAQAGALEQLERDKPAVARKTCQTVPVALTRGPFLLETNPDFAVLRSHGEDSTN